MEKDLLKKLESLAQLDRDAVSVYDEALKHAEDEDVKTHFKEFHDEHEYHVTQLSAAIVKMGGQAPKLRVDFAGHMADWVTTLRSMGGTKGALHAMRTAEKYHNSHYAETQKWDVDDAELKSMLDRFYGEEKRHLEFVESKLGVHATQS